MTDTTITLHTRKVVNNWLLNRKQMVSFCNVLKSLCFRLSVSAGLGFLGSVVAPHWVLYLSLIQMPMKTVEAWRFHVGRALGVNLGPSFGNIRKSRPNTFLVNTPVRRLNRLKGNSTSGPATRILEIRDPYLAINIRFISDYVYYA